MNPLFNALGGNQMNPMLQQLLQFKNSLTGDPQQQIQQMLNSGRITQVQLNQAMQQAQGIATMLGLR